MSLDHVNLLPKEMRTSAAPDAQKALVISAVVGVVLIIALAGTKSHQLSLKQTEYDRLAAAARSMGASVQEVTSRVKNTEQANRKVASAREFLEKRITWTEALKELSLVIPKSAWLSSLMVKSNEESGATFLEIQGYSPTQSLIASFLESLETSANFHQITLKRSERVSDITPDLYKFTFEVSTPQIATATAMTTASTSPAGSPAPGKSEPPKGAPSAKAK